MTPAERLRRVLSPGQIEAPRAVLTALGATDESVINGAQVAVQQHITRSTVVTALKLAEAAGVLEAQSLGVSGTHIRILDREALVQAVAD